MKVLIVSHNCFSASQSMGKTLRSLFSGFQKSELMQLYFYPSLPNVDVCGDYFRITDNDIKSSIVHRRRCGRIIHQDEVSTDNTLFADVSEREQFSKINRRSPILRKARDIMWRLGSWKTAELLRWLDRGKPDVVFYALGDARFSQRIAVKIAAYLQIPLVTYACDDFYLSTMSLPLFQRWMNRGIKAGVKKTVKKSRHVVTICDDLGEAYEKLFATPYTTVMTGSSFSPGTIQPDEDSRQLSYIGNLSLNRWKSLLHISAALEKFNQANGTDYTLHYYGAENENMKGRAVYGGRISPEQVKEVMGHSRMLIHTESFAPEYVQRVRYSVSTKIADSLASGVPLLAYGPAEVASMRHLEKNQCAVIATDADMLEEQLAAFLRRELDGAAISERAMATAELHHNTAVNSSLIRSLLQKLIAETSAEGRAF